MHDKNLYYYRIFVVDIESFLFEMYNIFKDRSIFAETHRSSKAKILVA